MFKHSYSLRVSTVFKNYNFKDVMYIMTIRLKHSLQQKLTHTQMHTCAHVYLSLIHISEPTRQYATSRMPSSA